MKTTYTFLFVAFLSSALVAQEETNTENEPVTKTFNATRLISSHTIETLYKGEIEYRIEHRFGDFAGTNGGSEQGFGFDEAKDIRFALEYGISKKLMIGLARTKGSTTAYRSNLDGFLKYKILEQKQKGMPISMTVVGSALYTYATASSDTFSFKHYPKFAHRFAYATQLNIARKFNDRLSLSVMPTWVHRNYVNSNDVNDLFSVGVGGRFKIAEKWSIISEYFHTFVDDDLGTGLTDVFGIGAAWSTFGHNFHFTLSNSSLFNEMQFIPFTTEKWSKGQFRIGFSISRSF